MTDQMRLNNINIDLNKVPTERCICGHNQWRIVYLIKKVSALVSPTGKETVVPIQIFACDKCGLISPLFKNLNDTEELPRSAGESLGGAIASSEPTPKQPNTAKLII
jgi:hypothetical protein